MKRTIIQIDGGHLRALTQTASRNYTPDFIEAFANSLPTTEEDLIRILYYDCAPYIGEQARPISGEIQSFDKSDEWLRDLSVRDLFAVRRGILKWRGWKPRRALARGTTITDQAFKPDFEQKGVDLRIGLDIATYSIEKSIDRIILVTGDTDLIPALKLARRQGVQVIGIILPNNHLSSELRAHFDFSREVAWPSESNAS